MITTLGLLLVIQNQLLTEVSILCSWSLVRLPPSFTRKGHGAPGARSSPRTLRDEINAFQLYSSASKQGNNDFLEFLLLNLLYNVLCILHTPSSESKSVRNNNHHVLRIESRQSLLLSKLPWHSATFNAFGTI